MKYVRMNEADSVFANEDYLFEVPYVEPSFWKVLMSSPWFQYLMTYEWMIWKKLCVIYYVLFAIWCLWWCMLLSWHDFPNPNSGSSWTFLSKFGKFTDFHNHNLESPLTWLPIIMLLGKSYSFSCMSLVCAWIYRYLVQVCNNPIQTLRF